MTAEPSQPEAAQESPADAYRIEPRGAKFWLERARRVLQDAKEKEQTR